MAHLWRTLQCTPSGNWSHKILSRSSGRRQPGACVVTQMWLDGKSVLNPQAWLSLLRAMFSFGNSCSKLGVETAVHPKSTCTIFVAAGASGQGWGRQPGPSALCIPLERTSEERSGQRSVGIAQTRQWDAGLCCGLSQGRASPLLLQFVFSLCPVLNKEFEPTLPRVVKC